MVLLYTNRSSNTDREEDGGLMYRGHGTPRVKLQDHGEFRLGRFLNTAFTA
jgi:predicted chitinase